MQRFTFSLALAFVGCVGMRSAFAQDEPYGEPPPEEPYGEPPPADEPYSGESYEDQGYEAPYEEADAPYDDYDVEPYEEEGYDESYDQPVDEGNASIDTFYESLAPYGRWVQSPSYGLIWVPSRRVVGPRFVPYATGGRWHYSDVGWMFASDWDWGWAPFHYGRWYRDPRWGWSWVPGSVWAPSWVDWRFGGGVVGWAPLPPRRHRAVWVFVRARDINRPHVHRYVVRDAPRYYRSTAPVRHRHRSGRAYWYSGPRRDQIERVGRVRLRPIRVRPPRAGVVARVRVQGSRVRQERVAPPRKREITRSRRELPASTRRQRPDVRRPDVRNRPDRPGQRRDVRPDPRPRRDVRPERPQPDRRPEVRDRPEPRRGDGPEMRPRPEPRRDARPDRKPEPRPEAKEPRPRPEARPDRPDRDKPSKSDAPKAGRGDKGKGGRGNRPPRDR